MQYLIIYLFHFLAIWNDFAVHLLFTLHKKYEKDFKSTIIKNDIVWDKIKVDMTTDGYNFTMQQIKDKWANMRKYYMRVKDHNNQSGAEPKTYKYYNEMDAVYGKKPNVKPVAIASNMRSESWDAASSLVEDSETDEPKRKLSKLDCNLTTWSESFVQYSKEKENRQEERQKEQIAAIENATKTFKHVMEKLIEKL